jgi:dTDP-4-amino-4,6-dideoxygalactose transaminase
VQVENRDVILQALHSRDIHCGVHYPLPIHLQDAYRNGNHVRSPLPIAESIAPRLLSLPIYPEMEEAQVDYVAAQLSEVVQQWSG